MLRIGIFTIPPRDSGMEFNRWSSQLRMCLVDKTFAKRGEKRWKSRGEGRRLSYPIGVEGFE